MFIGQSLSCRRHTSAMPIAGAYTCCTSIETAWCSAVLSLWQRLHQSISLAPLLYFLLRVANPFRLCHSHARAPSVFCNRNVDMDQVKFIGFDMDYTLCQYKVVLEKGGVLPFDSADSTSVSCPRGFSQLLLLFGHFACCLLARSPGCLHL